MITRPLKRPQWLADLDDRTSRDSSPLPVRAPATTDSEHSERTVRRPEADQRHATGNFPAEAGALLGTTTKKLSAVAASALKAREKRSGRWGLLQLQWSISSLPRVAGCRRRRLAKKDDPAILKENGCAHFAGLQLCGSVWACPVCGAVIRQARAEEINRALVTLLNVPIYWGDVATDLASRKRATVCNLDDKSRAETGSAYLFTATLPHDFGEELRVLLDTITAGHSALTSGRAWMDDKKAFRLVGYIRAHDATDGQNGWHPHLHSVLCVRGELSPLELTRLRRRLYVRWARSIVGKRPRAAHRTGDVWREASRRAPSYRHGIHLEQARSVEDLARYAATVAGDVDEAPPAPTHSVMVGRRSRVGLELTRNDLKTGLVTAAGKQVSRTPWEILRAIHEAPVCDEDGVVNDARERDRRRWREWEQETRGTQAMRWSDGLKAILGVLDREDSEIVGEAIGGEVVHAFNSLEWGAVTGTRGAPARVLEIAEDAGSDGVAAYLAVIVPAWMERQARDREWEQRHADALAAAAGSKARLRRTA